MPWLGPPSVPPVSDAWHYLSVSRSAYGSEETNSELNFVTAIFVGPARQWIPELIERAKNLKVSGGFEEGTDL